MPCGAGAGPVRPEVPCPRAVQVALAKSSSWHEEQVPAPKQRGWHLCTCCRAGGHLAHACAPGVCPTCHPAPAPAASASGSGLPGHRGQQGAGRARGPAWAGVQMHILKIPPRNPAPGGAPSGCTAPGAGGGEGAAAETSQSPGIVGAPPDGEMGATPCPPTRGALLNTPVLTARSGSRGSAQASLISSRCLRATSFCEKRLLLGSFELTQHEKATARAGAAGSRRLVSHRPLSCSGTGAGEGGVRPKPPAARPHGAGRSRHRWLPAPRTPCAALPAPSTNPVVTPSTSLTQREEIKKEELSEEENFICPQVRTHKHPKREEKERERRGKAARR